MSVLTLENPKLETQKLIEKLYQAEGKAEMIDGEIVEFMSTGGIDYSNRFYFSINQMVA